MSKFFITLVTLMFFAITFSQEVETTNPIARLNQFINQVSSSEEHLIHKEKVGPYLVNADGQRLVKHPYLKFDITKDGEALSTDSTVRLESKLHVHTKDPLIRTYTATRDGDRFVIDPIDLTPLKEVDHTYGGWLVFDLIISDGETEAQREFDLDYYSPRPEVSFLFRLLNTLIPIIVLVIAFAVFKLRSLERNQLVQTSV